MTNTPAFLLVIIAAAGCTEPALADHCAHDVPAPLVGAWRAALQFDGGVFASIKDLSFMYVFNDAGTLTESSNYDAAPPVPPAYGVWRAKSVAEYELKYEFFVTQSPKQFDELVGGGGWLPAGRGVFSEHVRLAPDRNSFDSTITYEAFDDAGASVIGGGNARGHGVRIDF